MTSSHWEQATVEVTFFCLVEMVTTFPDALVAHNRRDFATLVVEDLHRALPDGTVLLDDVSVHLVAGEVVAAGELVTRVVQTCPDVVLLGWELPGIKGTALISVLQRPLQESNSTPQNQEM